MHLTIIKYDSQTFLATSSLMVMSITIYYNNNCDFMGTVMKNHNHDNCNLFIIIHTSHLLLPVYFLLLYCYVYAITMCLFIFTLLNMYELFWYVHFVLIRTHIYANIMIYFTQTSTHICCFVLQYVILESQLLHFMYFLLPFCKIKRYVRSIHHRHVSICHN